jgi:hypothetical protein
MTKTLQNVKGIGWPCEFIHPGLCILHSLAFLDSVRNCEVICFFVFSGGDQDLVLCGGGNTSVKETFVDVFGDKHDALYVKGSGWDLAVRICCTKHCV